MEENYEDGNVGIDIEMDFIKGDKGDTGEQGPKGEPGYTPVKGTDYYTESDKEAILNDIKASNKTLIDNAITEAIGGAY